MSQYKFDKRLNLFLDRGLNYWLSRYFAYDYNLARDLDLVGSDSVIDEIDTKLTNMGPLKQNTVNDQVLVKKLNAIVKSKNLESWSDIESDVLRYFNSGMMIHEDLYSTPTRPGYHLATTGEHRGRLRLLNDKGDISTVCTFDTKQMNQIALLFPSLFPDKRYVAGVVGPKRAKLTSPLFIKLISLAQENDKTKDAQFHLTADKSFMSVFHQVKERMELKAKRGKDPRDQNELVTEIIKNMQSRIATYLSTAPSGRNKRIMEAINLYLQNGDSNALAKVVSDKDNARSWFSWLVYSDEADRTLLAITRMQKSDFFESAIKNINLVSRPDNALGYEQRLVNRDAHERDVQKYWSSGTVTKEALQRSLDSMLLTLQQLEAKHTTLLPIPLPQSLQNIPEDTEDTEETNEAEKGDKKTVIGHIISRIKELQSSVKTQKGTNFQSDCADLENSINIILDEQYIPTDIPTDILTDTQQVIDNEAQRVSVAVGEMLQNSLRQIDIHPRMEDKIMVSPSEVKNEIQRLITFYMGISSTLGSFRSELVGMKQSIFPNDIGTFVSQKLKPRIDELYHLLRNVDSCPNKSFNMKDRTISEPQKVLCNAIELLEQHGKKLLTREMNDMLLYANVTDAASCIRRSYETMNSNIDKTWGPVFVGISERVAEYTNSGLSEEAKPRITKTVVSDNSAQRLSGGRFFSNPSDGEQTDAESNASSTPSTPRSGSVG